jgi:hypothetical protein
MGTHPTIPFLSFSLMISVYDSHPTCDSGISHFSGRECYSPGKLLSIGRHRRQSQPLTSHSTFDPKSEILIEHTKILAFPDSQSACLVFHCFLVLVEERRGRGQ